jgi:hypothetical protein
VGGISKSADEIYRIMNSSWSDHDPQIGGRSGWRLGNFDNRQAIQPGIGTAAPDDELMFALAEGVSMA